MLRSQTGEQNGDDVIIRGSHVLATSPEGQQFSMALDELMRIIAKSYGWGMDDRCVLPDGVKAAISRGAVTLWVYEKPPQLYNLKWISSDSKAPYGRGTTYTNYRISLPYLIVIAVFLGHRSLGNRLSNQNECFFRTSPLKSLDDEMFYPALLNCSRFDPPEGHPLSWICTANMDLKALKLLPDENLRMRESLRVLLHCLLETGYNYSSEYHEGSSWYTETVRAGIDPRLSGGMEAWQKASEKDSLFVLDVPWLSTGLTLGEIIERIFKNINPIQPKLNCANDIRRILFNHAESA